MQELAVAVLLDRGTIEKDTLDATVCEAVVAEGWNCSGETPTVGEVGRVTWDLIHVDRAFELIDHEYEYNIELRTSRQQLSLNEAGRVALRLALRGRALAPVASL